MHTEISGRNDLTGRVMTAKVMTHGKVFSVTHIYKATAQVIKKLP